MVDRFVLYNQKDVLNTTFINLFTTIDCQLNCNYCVEKMMMTAKGAPENIGKHLFGNTIKFIRAQETDNVFFHFYGGEPTLHPNLLQYIVALKVEFEDRIRIKLSTNLERELEYYEKIPEYVEVWASIHRYHDFKELHQRAKMLNEKGMLKKLFLMCSPTDYKIAHEIYETIQDLSPQIYPIDKFRRTTIYKKFKESYTFVEHDPFEDFEDVDIVLDGRPFWGIPTVERFNNFEGCLCNAGFDIYPNGNVHYCAKDDIPLMNLIVDQPRKLERYHVCHSKDCPCDPEFGRYSIKQHVKELLTK